MWQKLEPRERLLLLIAGGMVIIALLFVAGRKIYRLRTDLSETVNDTPGQLAKLDKIIGEYLYFSTLDTTGGERDPSEFSGKLEKIFLDHGVKDRISTMKPIPAKDIDKGKYQVLIFDVNFRGVTLESMMKVVYDIDKNKRVNAKVEFFQVSKPYQDRSTYDVNMKIAAYSGKAR
ncbi:hypothetical protein LEP1GSC047_3872 [Leptospira inadai serovar Lyme str. 10]|uniref:Type II secretion system protein M n=2 Tax=Leptospira inadai serovar Lyme TaxID=293084 RepID=V6HEC3_9LEPT|nr:hypothetical protein [Leptospira inadai]EQA37658.1 hypothetical protein LEP1GSC047_3872 [Leptospira inadai serovar Lyme str. 10]PNV76318.1 hypothetical protein BES34_004790 [Leptospira inadai serovar Lyme]